MNFNLSFKIENNPNQLIHVTHLFSKIKCKIIEFSAKQLEATNQLSIYVSVQGDKKMYQQFVHLLNNSISVIDIRVVEKEKAAAY